MKRKYFAQIAGIKRIGHGCSQASFSELGLIRVLGYQRFVERTIDEFSAAASVPSVSMSVMGIFRQLTPKR